MLQATTRFDRRDVPYSACKTGSLDDYEIALRQFQSYVGDPTETLARTLENDPEFVMGHVFNACAMLMATERQYLPNVQQSIEAAESLSHRANERERQHIYAARLWSQGRWRDAACAWDNILHRYPRDTLAAQCGHLTDFFIGDATNLRDRMSRIIGHWSEQHSGYSYILGLHAFGLEECNEFELAEKTARNALSIEEHDAWSIHAVTHVMEMQNRFEEGQHFLHTTVNDWAVNNAFAYHNWWHLGLFYIEQEDFAGALALYDEHIFPDGSELSMELLDATAFLWRLHLLGIDLADRWQAIADLWRSKTAQENGYYAFNDFHAVVAMVGAGRFSDARQVLHAVEQAAENNPVDTRSMARDVGIATCSAIIAFGEARYTDAIEFLYPARSIAHRFGGSNAQRDILTQTLIEAALRDNRLGLVENLLNERALHKADSPLTQRWKQKLSAN